MLLWTKKHAKFQAKKLDYTLLGNALRTDDASCLKDGKVYTIAQNQKGLIQLKEVPNRWFAIAYFDLLK